MITAKELKVFAFACTTPETTLNFRIEGETRAEASKKLIQSLTAIVEELRGMGEAWAGPAVNLQARSTRSSAPT